MDRIFSSWKEIAAYLGKGVRTVQRWEAHLNLPVHRPSKRGVIIAYQSELDRWTRHTADMLARSSRLEHDELRKRSLLLRETASRRIQALRGTLERTSALEAAFSEARARFNRTA